MVQRHHEVGSILGNIDIDVPVAGQQLRQTVGQVGAHHVVQRTIRHSLVELCQTAGEQREGGVGDDAASTALFQVAGNFQHALAGSDDVVRDEDSLALHGIAQILVGHDGVAAVHDAGIVTALVEHAQVAAQHTGEVHVAAHCAFVGADHDELLLVEADLRVLLQQALEDLIGRHRVVEAEQGHGVLDAGVVCVKGDDVLYAHGLQLLQGHSAVQALADDAAMLAAAVQAGHDDRHAVCLAGHGLDEALQVCEMVVGREVVLVTEQVVGHAVVARIDNDEDIVAADGLLDQTLCVAALEAGALAGDDEAILLHTGRLCPLDKVSVDEVGQLLCTGAGQQTQICNAGLLKKCHRVNFVRHCYNSFMFLKPSRQQDR